MIYAPIYKDIYYQTSASTFEYTIRIADNDSDESIVFQGKAIKSPEETELNINISKLCRDWLENNLGDFREYEDDVVSHPKGVMCFNLFSGELLLESYTFLYNWCYNTDWEGENKTVVSNPINGHTDPRMKMMFTAYSTGDTFEYIIIDPSIEPPIPPTPVPQEIVEITFDWYEFSQDYIKPAIEGTTQYDYVENIDWLDIYYGPMEYDDGHTIHYTNGYGIEINERNYNEAREGTIDFYDHYGNIAYRVIVTQKAHFSIPNNTIYYKGRNGYTVDPLESAFNVNLISNEYVNEWAVMTFDGPVTEIGDRAFNVTGYSSSLLEMIIMPDSVRTIGESAFEECEDLYDVVFSNNLTEIKDKAFYYCTDLRTCLMPDTITTLGDSAFAYPYHLHHLKISSGLTELPHMCFYQASTLSQDIYIPNTIKVIGGLCFSEALASGRIFIPEGVEEIGGSCFRYTGIGKLVIPRTVREIGHWAFLHTTGTLYFYNTVPCNLGNEVFASGISIKVPYSSVDTYKDAWPEYSEQITAI